MAARDPTTGRFVKATLLQRAQAAAAAQAAATLEPPTVATEGTQEGAPIVRVTEVTTTIANNRMQHSALNLLLATPQGNFVITAVEQHGNECVQVAAPAGETVGMRLRDIYAQMGRQNGQNRVLLRLADGTRREVTHIGEGREEGTNLRVTVTLGNAEHAAGAPVQDTPIAAPARHAALTAQEVATIVENMGLPTTGGISVRHGGKDYGAEGIVIGQGGQWVIEVAENATASFSLDRLSGLIEESTDDIGLFALLPDGTTIPIVGVFVGATDDTSGLQLRA